MHLSPLCARATHVPGASSSRGCGGGDVVKLLFQRCFRGDEAGVSSDGGHLLFVRFLLLLLLFYESVELERV